MKVAQVNTTGLRSFKAYMRRALARGITAVCAQETGVTNENADEISQWLARRGWHNFIEPALVGKGDKGTTLAGAIICARPELGLRRPRGGTTIQKSRALMGVVSPPGWPDLALVSAYFWPGKGMTKTNAALCADIGCRLAAENISS